MSLREVLADVVVQNKQRFEDGVRAYFGSGEEWSLRYDSSAGEFILVDESGPAQALRIPDGQTLSAVLESGGVHELDVSGLSGDLADAQDPKAHASDHYEGGPDAMVLEQLAANSTDDTLVFGPDGAGGVGTSTVSDLGGLAPGKLDSAETFAESDVTVSHNKTVVSSQSVQLGAGNDPLETVSRPADGSGSEYTTQRGLVVNPNESIPGVQVTISNNTQNATNLSIERLSDNTVIADKDGLSVSSGDIVRFNAELSSGTDYVIYTKGDGSFNIGRYFESGGIGDTIGAYIDIVNGWNGSLDNERMYAVNDIEPLGKATSGNSYIEWPYPDVIYDWDQALFQRSLDNETVDVYLQENDGTGFEDIAGPISRGDPITADPSNEVRFRVELSRADTNNNPTLDAIYRRYLV